MKNILLKNKLKECLGERLILSSKGPEKLTFIFFLFFDWNQSISSPPDTAVVAVYGVDLLWPKDRYSAYWVNFKIHALHQGLAQKRKQKKRICYIDIVESQGLLSSSKTRSQVWTLKYQIWSLQFIFKASISHSLNGYCHFERSMPTFVQKYETANWSLRQDDEEVNKGIKEKYTYLNKFPIILVWTHTCLYGSCNFDYGYMFKGAFLLFFVLLRNDVV